MRNRLFSVAIVTAMVVFGPIQASSAQQDSNTATEEPAATAQPEQQPTDSGDMPRAQNEALFSLDDIWTREKLTGDWGGARTALKDHGLTFGLQLIQTYQGVASGGSNTSFDYGGRFDFTLDVDGEKLGLWKGLFANVIVQNKFGRSINGDAGAFALPNTALLYPSPAESCRDVAVTQVLFMQFLSKNFALVGGKINSLDFWTKFYPETGGGIDGFMNTNLLAAAMPWLRWVTLSEWAFGPLFVTNEGQLQGGVFVLDLNNAPTTTGIPEMFDDGAGILGIWRFFFELDEKPGNVLLGFGGATREYFSFEETTFGFDPGPLSFILEGLEDKDNGVWSAAIYFQQVLWQAPANNKQNLRFFTGWSLSDGDPSFSKWAGLASIEATGLLFDREKDRAGVGWFYTGLSTDFKRALKTIGSDLRDYWGVELYYNAEITPWFHVTGDLQIVQNQNDQDDPAISEHLYGSHSGYSNNEEFNFHGSHGALEDTPQKRLNPVENASGDMPSRLSSAGSTAVWADENTRAGIFDAMKRKETYGTSGTLIRLRFFGGWDYPGNLVNDKDFVKKAYAGGVPMGGDLPPRKGRDLAKAPTFVIQALKDPESGNLDRIQVITYGVLPRNLGAGWMR